MNANTLEEAAHVVQLALTPVFLLSGIAALLNVFAARLARVADQAEKLAAGENLAAAPTAKVLRIRSRALDVAVVLASLAGAMTCGTVLVLFLDEVRGGAGATALFVLFGGAILLNMA
jgi:ABC-type uncharacterized transport system permease subunit